MKKFIKIIKTVCTILVIANCCTAFGMNVALQTFADARTDTGFKALMNDLKTAENIINAVVPDFEANPITLQRTDSICIPPLITAENQRQLSMDFHAVCRNGDHIVVEMQVERHSFFDERSLFYACDTYTRQLQNNILAQPHWYENLKKVYAIQLVDYDTNVAFSIKRKDDPLIIRKEGHLMKEGQYIKHFVFTDKTSGQMIDFLQMIQVELPRAQEILNLKPTQENITINSKNKTWLWLSIIKNAISYNDTLYEYIPADVKIGLNRLRIARWNSEDKEKYKEDQERINKFETSILDAKNKVLSILQPKINELKRKRIGSVFKKGNKCFKKNSAIEFVKSSEPADDVTVELVESSIINAKKNTGYYQWFINGIKTNNYLPHFPSSESEEE